MSHSSPTFIENEEAYDRATARRIQANREKGGRRRWYAREADAELINSWLHGLGEFAGLHVKDDRCTLVPEADGNDWIDHWEDRENPYARCKCKVVAHPLTAFNGGAFLDSMRKAIDEWGGLTPGQHAGVQKALERARERVAGREVERSAKMEKDRATSSHVGVVGERRDWVLTVGSCISRDGIYGVSYFHVCHDPDGNVVIYSGAHAWERGSTVKCKATIKKHTERDGVEQTWIARPKEEG